MNIKHYQCAECQIENNNKDKIGQHMYENHEQHERQSRHSNQCQTLRGKLEYQVM